MCDSKLCVFTVRVQLFLFFCAVHTSFQFVKPTKNKSLLIFTDRRLDTRQFQKARTCAKAKTANLLLVT